MYAFPCVLVVLEVFECMQITFGKCGEGPRLLQQGHLSSDVATNPDHSFRHDQLY